MPNYCYSESQPLCKRTDNYETGDVSYTNLVRYKYEYSDMENLWIIEKVYVYNEKFMTDCIDQKLYTIIGLRIVESPPIDVPLKKWKKVWSGNWDFKDWFRVRAPYKKVPLSPAKAEELRAKMELES